ncbi:DUF2231 domain-containing protein [Nodosilinea nodulosa]|uniref:DUF2231 domain-containing protein n=1 Tax=Nodosilinea nodulosa TaxID=416001 RepID=UPI0002F42AAF|nr:DUF2231 domain-containing protein [Nodosilinea nodulosa]
MNPQLIEQLKQLGIELGANGLPYRFPIHPNFVHLTLGLFIIAIAFDFAGTLFPLERSILKFFAMLASRSNFFDVAWYNTVAAAVISFFTVAAGFFELLLADPLTDVKSAWGLRAGTTMLLHGVGGVLLLTMIVGMTVWRGYQRFRWRQHMPQQVQWSYLLAGVLILGYMFIHGTLGAHLGAEFGVHNTAAGLIRQGENPNQVLQPEGP